MRRIMLGVLVAGGLIAGGCGSAERASVATAPDGAETTASEGIAEERTTATTTVEVATPVEPVPDEWAALTMTVLDVVDRPPPPEGGIEAPRRRQGGVQAFEYCNDRGDWRIEMAFAAAVRTVDLSQGLPWVTFDVETRYTDDIGTEVALWAPEFTGIAGERWLIVSSRYRSITGDVYWCESLPLTPEAQAEWDDRYGGGIEPGRQTPENEPSSEVVKRIADARAQWQGARPASYTATLVVVDPRVEDNDRCGARRVRVVVERDAVVQAFDVARACVVDPDRAPTVDGLFSLATEFAGAVTDVEYVVVDPRYGYPVEIFGSDRSVEFGVAVRGFLPEALALDLAAPAEALATASDRWAASGVEDYTATFEVRCFCGVESPYTVVVRDNVVVESTIQRPEADWPPLTVDELFATILGHHQRGADRLSLAFDPELGYPVLADVGQYLNGDDDEVTYRILELVVDG